MYVITGATGHVGGRIAEVLLAAGKKIRAIGRNTEKLKLLSAKGAEIFHGDMESPSFLPGVFAGAEAVFSMIPPKSSVDNLRAYQNKIGENIAGAIVDAGVKYVVNLSSLGAQYDEGTGPVNGLHDQEERLNRIPGINAVHIRAGYFMENFYGSIALIKRDMFGSAMRGDIKIPLIATRDIGTVAAKYLLNLSFSGVSIVELLGQRDLTMTDVARILGKAVGKPNLKYTQFSYEDAEKAMIQGGLSAEMTRAYIEMSKAVNDGLLYGGIVRTTEKSTDTSFEEFSKMFVSAIAA